MNIFYQVQEPSLLSSMESDTSPTRCIKGRHSSIISFSEKPKSIICPTCGLATEMTIHGVYRLPQNILIARKIREATGNSFDRLSNSCQLCPFSVDSTTSCTTCALNLCNNCKAVHKRHTSNHEFKSLEKKSKKFFEKSSPKCSSSSSIKCLIHSNNVLKLFCTTCCALICSECTILIHRGHKMTSVSKAAKIYIETLKEAKDNTKPLSIYAIHSISKLNEISKKINLKCDVVEDEVMMFISEYFEALEVHKQTLLHQIARCRETKMDIIKCQQIDLERRSNEAKTAIDFTETLLNEGTDEENLMFLNLLLRKFDSCRSSDKTLDIKITDSLQFLPEVKAPSNQAQKNIPLYGIITTQVAVARNCTLDVISGLMNLRVHKKAELILLTRDVEERAMCHGSANVEVKATYRDIPSKDVPVQVTDKRDGTYTICFIPDIPGFIKISIMVNGKSILDSPFTVRARNLRPHIGIFHCCSFCSSNGKKICACGAEMEIEGYKGCGHGHHGWPGRRHWSCCGSLLENSECSVANAIKYNKFCRSLQSHCQQNQYKSKRSDMKVATRIEDESMQ
ncbi:CLUMA_CG001301, isoform A, partial [Clunio marinus]